MHSSAPRIILARFPGTCSTSGKRFYPGAQIRKTMNGYELITSTPAKATDPAYEPKGTKEALCALYARQDWTADFSDDPGPSRRAAAFEESYIRPEEVACSARGINFRPIRRWYVAKAFGNQEDMQDAERAMNGEASRLF